MLAWVARRMAQKRKKGEAAEYIHTTRMTPRRGDELLGGGSLYWVIKGNIQLRQPIIDLRAIKDEDGISRCQIVMEPKPVATVWQPKRPFQGWRYFKADEAPADLTDGGAGIAEFPEELRRELASLGLL